MIRRLSLALCLLPFAACRCGGSLVGQPDSTPDGGLAIPDAGQPVAGDAGQPPPPPGDSGTPSPGDSGTPPPSGNPQGCADGTREGFQSLDTYPDIAACSGAWSVPGLFGVAPACANGGGNSGVHADGQGCSAADLCAAGWHICNGHQEVEAKTNGAGCSAGLPQINSGPGLFFAIAQPSCDNTICDDPGASCSADDDHNDIFGCSAPGGHLGQQLTGENDCGALNAAFASTAPNDCGWTQAQGANGPWSCQGSDSLDEGDHVTKDGCQGNSCCTSNNCYNNGPPLGPSDEGGVLCCRD